jgi:hypothetical protein
MLCEAALRPDRHARALPFLVRIIGWRSSRLQAKPETLFLVLVIQINRFEVYGLEAVNSSEWLEQRSKALFR